MRGLKFIEKFKSTQVHALNQQDASSGGCNGCANGSKLSNHKRTKFTGSKSNKSKSGSVAQALLPYGLPSTDLLEPSIDPHLKPIQCVKALADLYRRFETCLESDKSMLFIEQYAYLCGLGDAKLLRRCLRSARQYAGDLHLKVVLSAWLRFDRREDDLLGSSSMDCSGFILECPKAALISGCDPNSTYDHCKCSEENAKSNLGPIVEKFVCLSLEEDDGVTFCVGDKEIIFVRNKIASLSSPFKAMLYGGFVESKRKRIDFSHDGVSVEGLRAVEVYTRTSRVDLFCPGIVLELLSFANRFCCEEMKSASDAHLASLVGDIEDALILIDYGLEERANLLVASCLQVLLRELPSSLYNPKVMKIFCSSEATERLANVGHASFLLYYFLSQVAMEKDRVSNTTVMLLERLGECSTERWQRMLALHQLGCVMFEREEYEDACHYFEAAADAGHIYSLAGLARAKYKLGQQYSAYKLMNSIISEHKPTGWMYQERSLYNLGREKIVDLNYATELDPTLSFPYKYRAVAKMEEGQIRAAISEIDRIIVFKLSVDCLELRAWLFIAAEDYESALRDTLALLALESNYMMFHGRVSGDHLVKLLNHHVRSWSPADCWIKLYDRWSSVDDIGSLAVINQMLINDPGKSFLRFRQSLLLLR